MDPNSRFLTLEIATEVFRSLAKAAGKLGGMHPNMLAANLIIRGLGQIEDIESSPEMKLFNLAQEVLAEKDHQRILISIAKHMQDRPDDEMIDRFITLAESLGFDPDVMISKAREEMVKGNDLVFLAPSSTKSSQAIEYLLEVMDAGVEYRASVMIREGEKRGLKPHHLKAARQSLQISSRRDSDGWVWMLTPISVREESNVTKD